MGTPATQAWPALPYEEWKDSLATLHLWTQVVGKIRLAHEPPVNHWWNITLYLTARGLTTSPMPYALIVEDCDGGRAQFTLEPMPVAEFYMRLMHLLGDLRLATRIRTVPCEIPGAIPFEHDFTHAAYDEVYVARFWRALLQADRLCKIFRSRFTGKVSPVHFFWGSFDLEDTA
jgi:hypothetical protein